MLNVEGENASFSLLDFGSTCSISNPTYFHLVPRDRFIGRAIDTEKLLIPCVCMWKVVIQYLKPLMLHFLI